jgi:hypothetical protein
LKRRLAEVLLPLRRSGPIPVDWKIFKSYLENQIKGSDSSEKGNLERMIAVGEGNGFVNAEVLKRYAALVGEKRFQEDSQETCISRFMLKNILFLGKKM